MLLSIYKKVIPRKDNIHLEAKSCKKLIIKKDYIKKPIEFYSLSILKRTNCCGDRYNNVCLIIDEDTNNQICTNTDSGFSNQESNMITWKIAKKIARKIDLYFRDKKHAQIADLQILYKRKYSKKRISYQCSLFISN